MSASLLTNASMLGMVSTSPNCPIEAQWFVGIYTVVIYAPLAFVYVVVATLFIKHPNAFHPLFVISFFLILLAYTTSAFILFVRNFLEFFFINQLIFSILEFILVAANYYTQPIVILALLERLAATVFVSNYEKSLQWIPYLIGQCICIIFVVLMSLSQHEGNLINNIQVVLSFVICLCLVALFWVNRNKTANSVGGKSTLTTRYQLAENIKALRIFVPFIVLDNVISLMFVVTSYTISIARKFDEDECNKSSSYVPIFTVFRTIAILIQISMAVIVVYMHESMKLWSWRDCYRRSNRSQDVSVTMNRPDRLKIKNVLGKNIVEQETGENYFAQLSKQWQKV